MNPTTILIVLLLLSDESMKEKLSPVLSLLSDPKNLSMIANLLSAPEGKREEKREEKKEETPGNPEVSDWLQRIMQK
ncbi:MAG: hypothetical protein ACI4U2_07435 [Christensenellaceae bacterium]